MQTTVSIPGIHCEGCKKLIEEVTFEFPDVQHVDVNLETKKVVLDHGEDFIFDQWKTEIESLNPAYTVHPLPAL